MDLTKRAVVWRSMCWVAGLLGTWCLATWGLAQHVDSRIQLATSPALSPDGSQLAFTWMGDVWTVDTQGGIARRLTWAQGTNQNPVFSPDGTRLAFNSNRNGTNQIYVMPTEGGIPEQLTFHSEGSSVVQWTMDGQSLLIQGDRDHYWRRASRFMLIAAEPRAPERVLFDDYGSEGVLCPNDQRLLFTREGVSWYRKGYYGSQAGQIWSFDLESREFQKLVEHPLGARAPLWHPDGDKYYFVSQQSGTRNLWLADLASGDQQQLTHLEDDGVLWPAISRDGSTIVFRQLFDFYRFRPGQDVRPQKIEIQMGGDAYLTPTIRSSLNRAQVAAFSSDALEIAMIAGNDLWVMDTTLKEPVQITHSAQPETDVLFGPDNDSILFVSDREGQSDIWRARRADESRYWWQQTDFHLDRLTTHPDVESNLTLSPDGKRLAFVRGAGDLWVMDPDGKNAKRIFQSWNLSSFDWSPDGKWIAFSMNDNNFMRNVYIIPSDGSKPPFNVSLSPHSDSDPVWSPDGKWLAFTGRRLSQDTDIYLVMLKKEEDEETRRDRLQREAIEKMQKARKETAAKKAAADGAEAKDSKSEEKTEKSGAEDEAKDDKEEKPEDEGEKKGRAKAAVPDVVIDFDDMVSRIRRVSISGTNVRQLFWSPDGKKLAFAASIGGRSGYYTIEPPDKLSPEFLSSTTGSRPVWLSTGNQIVLLAGGVPTSVKGSGGAATAYSFSVAHEVDRVEKNEVAFDQAWRIMRDRFYDGNLNNKNWNAIRRKYSAAARDSHDLGQLSQVINMMLGELNASHMGFRPGSSGGGSGVSGWRDQTAHFGLRFDPMHTGPGLKVRDVIRESPAWQLRSRVEAGELVLAINGQEVDPDMDLTTVLNGRLDRDFELRVQDAKGGERLVTIRPISFGAARSLLYEHWIAENRRQVEEASQGKLGYLHIRGMNMSSFQRFERELYEVAHDKQGLIIDVRENGGGSTADHLLTSLTQPRHAITVPRGGGPGYPTDRTVYTSWHLPIAVLCNQNSFSNAEIFSHAIKTLQRGPVVGVATAGGVISTGSASVLDLGSIRTPGRGWYVVGTGEDMELSGAVPDHVLWPLPEQMPQWKDIQLEKAIEALGEEMQRIAESPDPELVPASRRPLPNFAD